MIFITLRKSVNTIAVHLLKSCISTGRNSLPHFSPSGCKKLAAQVWQAANRLGCSLSSSTVERAKYHRYVRLFMCAARRRIFSFRHIQNAEKKTASMGVEHRLHHSTLYLLLTSYDQRSNDVLLDGSLLHWLTERSLQCSCQSQAIFVSRQPDDDERMHTTRHKS